MKPELALPLEVVGSMIRDANGRAVAISYRVGLEIGYGDAYHRAEVIAAALTRDAEENADG